MPSQWFLLHSQVCDGIDLPAVSLCHNVLTNMRFGLPDITLAEELSPMPQSSLHFPHRDVLGFDNLPIYVRFDQLDESFAQTDESMKEVLASMKELYRHFHQGCRKMRRYGRIPSSFAGVVVDDVAIRCRIHHLFAIVSYLSTALLRLDNNYLSAAAPLSKEASVS